MYYLSEGSKQAFAPFEQPSHGYPQANQTHIFPTPYLPSYYPTQQPPFSPMQPHSYLPLHAKNQRPPIINAFLKQDGTFDFQKTFQTVHQITNTVQQVSPLVKQVSSLFKLVK